MSAELLNLVVSFSGDIVALKKLKMEKEREGFPITSLREINMLLKAKHPNIVHVKVRVMGREGHETLCLHCLIMSKISCSSYQLLC